MTLVSLCTVFRVSEKEGRKEEMEVKEFHGTRRGKCELWALEDERCEVSKLERTVPRSTNKSDILRITRIIRGERRCKNRLANERSWSRKS